MNDTVRLAAAAVLVVSMGVASASDWTGFRGPKGSGASEDKGLPAELSKDNILWKVQVPGPGTSTPITHGDKIFLTCYTGYGTGITKGFKGMGGGKGKGGKGGKGGFGKGGFGKGGFGGPDTGGDQKKLRLVVMCLDRKEGKTLWSKEIEPKLPEAKFSGFLREHGYASSTPVTDGENIYVFFGKSGVFAFDMQGKQLWQADVGSQTHFWGSAASPVLHKNVVIINASIESGSLVGLDKKTGKELWRVKGIGSSWSSPVLVETKDGKHEVVVSIPKKIAAYDPETGKELWHCQGIGGGGDDEEQGGFGGFGMGGPTASSTPVTRDGIVYIMGGGGFRGGSMSVAIKAGGQGNVDKSHVLWRKSVGTGNCSPVLSGDHFCWVAGIANALSVADGSTAYQKRLYDARQEYVSAVAADSKIYSLTRFEGLFVLGGGGKFEKLGHLTFEGDDSVFNASPAVSDGRIYVRSNKYLYCLGTKGN